MTTSLSVAIISDRVSWEERQLIMNGPEHGLAVKWINDESLGLGAPTASRLAAYDLLLLRSRSYTRGGLIASLAEDAGLIVTNSAGAISLCENKALLRSALRAAKVPVPDFRLALSRADYSQAVTEIGVPLVLKPVFGGLGKRVTLIRDADTAQSVYDYVEDLGHSFEQACLVEPFLAEGASTRCFVVGDRLAGIAEFTPGEGGDWRNNSALGNVAAAAVADTEMTEVIDGVLGVLGHGIYGIDLFRTNDGYVVNEVNHAPGFRAVSSATGIDMTAAIAQHLRKAAA